MTAAGPHPDVVTLGEALVVIRPTDATPAGAAGRFLMSVAGAESNVAVALARLGHHVSFAGRVGDDAAGVRIRRSLRGEGVDVGSLHTDPGAPTGLLIRDTGGPHGINVDYHRSSSAGSRLRPGDVDLDAVAAARFLFITGLTYGLSETSKAAIDDAVRVGRSAGTVICWDPNLRTKLHPLAVWERCLRPLLGQVDVVLGSGDELRVVTTTATTEAAVSSLQGHGADTIVVRAGHDRTRVFQGDHHVEVPVDPVDAMDPVGAGDAFAGGLLSGLLDGIAIEEVVGRAHAVARRCVLTAGDIEGLPTRQELETDEDGVDR